MKEEAPAIESPWYRLEELATLLDVTERTILKWVAQGRVPAPRRMGRRWSRWPREQVNELLKTWGLQKPRVARTA